jgi:DNA segregation ATPase FtsK/SpoIIIE, S-DNA-T family
VDPGVPAGDLRRRLAVLTGDVRWAAPRALLQVAGSVLDDHHPAGAPPLLPGAHLAPGPAPDDDVLTALRAGNHLAVLEGPGSGRLVALADGARVRVPVVSAVGTGGPGRTTPSWVDVHRRGARVTVRVVGARGTMTARSRRRSGRLRLPQRGRRVGPRPRTWSPGDDVRVGGLALQLRGAVGVRRRGRRTPAGPAWVWTAGASACVALALAVALRQPVLLLTAVTGLAGLLGVRGARTPDAPTEPDATGTPAPSCPDVAGVRLTTALRLRDHAGTVPGDDAAWPADRTLALTGPRDRSLGAARALVLRTLGAGTPTRLVLRSGASADWRWTRWWGPSALLPGTDEDDVLVVSDGEDTTLGAWRLASPRARLLLVVPPGATVPAWAATVLRTGDDSTPGCAPQAVAADVADAQGRSAAALAWSLSTHGTAVPPTPLPVTALGELPGVPAPDAAAVARAWRPAGARTLATPVGTRPGGAPAVLDLVRDGPHALVAGTTGAGKSELLTTVVLGLALTHPPHRLAVLLVDFKGGTGLGPLARLPHVVDHVHDLDVAAARRTLVGLRAELRRREHLLARAGRTDVADLDPAAASTPARLLVVVDELRALVDDVPDAAAALSRLAAQGRALGMHLLLATQRPAGAVPADLRANVGLRIALRVADEEDSRDVVGCPDAAHLDVASPGRALVRIGSQPAAPLQVARARHRRTAAPVRLAAPVPSRGVAGWCVAPVDDDDVTEWVTACRQAASGLPGTAVPWLPPLPDQVTADLVATGADTDGLLVAVGDLPDEQRRTPVRWGPAHGHLLVLGGPRSGRSTTLLTVASHALLGGAHVHAVGLPDGGLDRLRRVAGEQLGTTLPVDDVHRALLLLDRLMSPRQPDGPEVVLLLDGLDALLDALATHARGAGVDLLTTLLRHPPCGVRVAAAGPVVPALSRLVGAFGLRLVLPVPDSALDSQAGVPHGMVTARTVPGRAVACTVEGALLCQVVLPARAGEAHPVRHASGAAPPAVRIGVLPERSVPPPGSASRGRTVRDTIVIGVGADGPGPVHVDPTRPLVVAGPPGTGRTTALHVLARGWAASGRHVMILTGHAPPPQVQDAPPGVLVLSPSDAPAVLDRAPGPRTATGDDDGGVLLVDDLDLLERASPQLAERLESMVDGRGGGPRVVALATTGEHAATGYRGPVAAALRARQVLVLDAYGPAASDLLGPTGAFHTDPRSRPPGRGVLRRGRVLVRVQVHDLAGRHRGAGAV